MKLNRYKKIQGNWHRCKFSSETPQRDQTGLHVRNCGYVERLYNWRGKFIYSSYWRLYYNYNSGHRIIANGQKTELKANKIYLIPSDTLFDFEGDAGINHFHCEFFFNRKTANRKEIAFILDAPDFIVDQIDSICSNLKKQDKKEILLHQNLAIIHWSMAQIQDQLEQNIPDSLEKAVKFIEQNLSSKIFLKEIAQHAAVSSESLNRQFRRFMKTTPVNFVNRCRISRACEQLSNSEKTLDEIADSLGFANRFYFSRIFKRETGISPVAFRKNNTH